jgi:hypothetical protein
MLDIIRHLVGCLSRSLHTLASHDMLWIGAGSPRQVMHLKRAVAEGDAKLAAAMGQAGTVKAAGLPNGQ